MPRSALIALLALTACPGLPDETGDTIDGTDPNPGTDPMDTAPPCPEDLFEDNDNAATATIPEALPVLGQVCEGDEDWYAIEALGACVTVVDLTFATLEGDLDLEIYNGEDRLAVSSSTTDDEQVRFFVEEDTTVQARVVGFFGAEAAYSLNVSAECDPCEQPDAFEPNDTPESAATATFPVMAEACVDDADWYALPAVASSGCLIDASLQAVGTADGVVSMQLFDEGNQLIQAGTISAIGTGIRSLGVPGDALVITTSEASAYELDANVSCQTVTPDCALTPPDVWGNATLATAVRLRSGIVVSGAVCEDGPDWWAVPYQDGCTTVITVDGTGLTATLFTNGSASTPVTVSGATPVATVTSEGPHQVRLNPADGGATYSIQANVVCAD